MVCNVLGVRWRIGEITSLMARSWGMGAPSEGFKWVGRVQEMLETFLGLDLCPHEEKAAARGLRWQLPNSQPLSE